MPPRKEPLNDQQEKFCREYLKDLNGTQAAIRAGYSKKTANAIACRLFTYVYIQKKIESGLNIFNAV